MNEEAGFIAALLAEPEERTGLLVYADWLDERGDPRAAYLRLLAAEKRDWDRLSELALPLDRVWVRVVTRRCGPGCTVEITGGPFAGQVGQVVGMYPNEDKVIAAVRITLWGRPIDVEVDDSLIERGATPPG